MLRLLRRRPAFARLWIGETVSLLGDWLSYVALSLLALQQGGGALAVAVVFAGHVLPTALVSPLAGAVVDRVDRRRALVGVQIAQAAVVAAMILAVVAGAFAAVQVLLFVRTAIAGFFYPAKQAAMRRLVAEGELVEANALDSATWSAAFAVGTALGGLLALAGPVVALVVDALTFVVAAVVLGGLDPLPTRRRSGVSPLATPAELARDVAVAVRFVRADRRLAEAVFAKTPMAFAGGAAWVSLNLGAYELGLFGSGALALGMVQAVRAVGTGVGPVAAARWLGRHADRPWLLRAATLLVIVAVVAFGLALGAPSSSALALVTVAAFLWGVGGGGSWVFSNAQIQARAPEGTLGRLASLDQLSFTTAQSLAALTAGFLVDQSGMSAHAAWWGALGGVSLLLWLVTAVKGEAAPVAVAVD